MKSCLVCGVLFSDFNSRKHCSFKPSFTFPFACTGCVVKSARQARRHNRRARRMGRSEQLEVGDWLLALKKNDFSCVCCRNFQTKLTLDHITPLRDGGKNSFENIQPLCFECHFRKDGIKPLKNRESSLQAA